MVPESMTHKEELVSNSHSLEIACDESGYEGEKLIGGTTDVFAHASVRLSTESAVDCIEELRDRIRSPAQEYKANHLLREKHRAVLVWVLGSSGPMHSKAHVFLTDKSFLLAGKLIDLLDGDVVHSFPVDRYRDDQGAMASAAAVHRDGQATFGVERWSALLGAFNVLMRAKDGETASAAVGAFLHIVEVLRLDAGTRRRDGDALRLIRQAGHLGDSIQSRVPNSSRMIPTLDPLIPAIAHAVAYWGRGGIPISMIHDRQNLLTRGRITHLMGILNGQPGSLTGGGPAGLLADLRLVDSRADPRVQIADFLAGVARKIASDELNRRGDGELTALLRPYVDSSSIWGDERSWSSLQPASSADREGMAGLFAEKGT